MHRLTHRDLGEALRFLAACDTGGGVHALAASVTSALPALIPAEVTVFGMANPRTRTLSAVENPRVTSPEDLATYVRASRKARNPPLDHYATTSDPEARRMSDFVSRRQFHCLPVYTEFYRRLRIEYVLGVLIHNAPTAFDGITLNRSRRDFDERDRQLLTLLRPHLVHYYRTAIAVDRLRADLALALRALETPGFGVAIVSEDGRLQLLSPGGAALLASYFGSRRQVDELPDVLARWVRHHAETSRDTSRLPSLARPLVVERTGTRLVVRLVRIGRDTLLLLEEPVMRADWLELAPVGLSARDARALLQSLREEVIDSGASMPEVARRARSLFHDADRLPAPHQLTPHEQRLLRLLTEGHSYKTAAALLGSSVHTVAFHLKQIYAKLEVHSKSEAVAKALRERIVQ